MADNDNETSFDKIGMSFFLIFDSIMFRDYAERNDNVFTSDIL